MAIDTEFISDMAQPEDRQDDRQLENPENSHRSNKLDKLVKGLGWFSIGLGLAEVAAPKQLARVMGVRNRSGLLRTLGLREIVSGVGILMARRPEGWIWARVAGDAMDLSLLGTALKSMKGAGTG